MNWGLQAFYEVFLRAGSIASVLPKVGLLLLFFILCMVISIVYDKAKEIYNPTSLYESIQLRVRFSETDPLGIVWHGNYIKYFEDAREAFGRKYGISYLDVERHGFATPIVKSVCEHKKWYATGNSLRHRHIIWILQPPSWSFIILSTMQLRNWYVQERQYRYSPL